MDDNEQMGGNTPATRQQADGNAPQVTPNQRKSKNIPMESSVEDQSPQMGDLRITDWAAF